MTPSRTPSIAIGVSFYVVLSLATSYLLFNGGTAMSTLAGLLSCLVAVLAPVVAVWHYTSTHHLTLLPGPGAGLGAAVGAAGAVLSGLIGWALQQAGVFPSTDEMMAQTRRQMIEDGLSPDEVDGMMEMMGGMSQSLVTQLGIGVVVGLIVGAVAGAIAAQIFKKGEPEVL